MNAGLTPAQEFILGLERVIFVHVAISYAIDGSSSLGTVFALQSYRQQPLGAAANLIQQAISYHLLDMPISRISDIALSDLERMTPSTSLWILDETTAPAARDRRNVHFRYAPQEPRGVAAASIGWIIGIRRDLPL